MLQVQGRLLLERRAEVIPAAENRSLSVPDRRRYPAGAPGEKVGFAHPTPSDELTGVRDRARKQMISAALEDAQASGDAAG